MKTGRKRIIEKLAAAAGQTPVIFLESLIARHSKLESMAAECGVTHPTIINVLRDYGIERKPAKAFAYDGIVDTMTGHCRRLGLKVDRVNSWVYRGVSRPGALAMIALCGADRVNRRKAGVSHESAVA